MTQANKIEVQNKLAQYIARHASQNAAANTLKGASPAIISQMINGKWEKISDEMWRNIATQIGISTWQKVDTRCYKLLTEAFDDAQRYSNVSAIIAAAGSGKTFAAADYVATHANAFHIVCCEWWGLQSFLSEVLRVMGLESRITNNDNSVMLNNIVKALRLMPNPVLIIDEADKLRDSVMYSFISLYNNVEGFCGMTLMATDNLERRIIDGLRIKKRGYNEIFSRIGRRFIAINGNNAVDVERVCRANGIEQPTQIDKIISDCDMDLRRVKHWVHSQKIVNQRNAAENGTSN